MAITNPPFEVEWGIDRENYLIFKIVWEEELEEKVYVADAVLGLV